MLAQGHLLIEDVPGTGKTSLARALAESVDGTLTRIQFTPDLLPSDVTGVQIFNQSNSEFEFHPGAVFANVVLADEINRASPKTQSSLLEVMEEYQVTVDGVPRPVPNPFLVVATMNPIEHDGTYALPEAQIDRFMMRLALGYPSAVAEIDIIDSAPAGRTRVDVEPVLSTEEVRQMARVADTIYISPRCPSVHRLDRTGHPRTARTSYRCEPSWVDRTRQDFPGIGGCERTALRDRR